MYRKLLATALLAPALAVSAQADQFAIQTAQPVANASEGLLELLHIREIDTVEIDGVQFIVIDAQDEGYVEAYVFAMNIDAIGLYRLKEDWDGAGLSSVPVQARGPFFHETQCDTCDS